MLTKVNTRYFLIRLWVRQTVTAIKFYFDPNYCFRHKEQRDLPTITGGKDCWLCATEREMGQFLKELNRAIWERIRLLEEANKNG